MTNLTNLTLARAFEQRTTQFGIDVIRYCKQIPETSVSRPIISQLVRSATSIGANYAEANNAHSRRDFANKISLCRKEAQETKHWLTVSEELDAQQSVSVLLIECHELILIFNSISSTIRNGKSGNEK